MAVIFEGSVAVNGTTLHARLEGPENGRPVVLVNSLATDHTMWDPQIAALTKQYRVLRYDVRGHGRSAIPAGPYTIDMLVDDLLGLLRHFKLERAHVVGISLGGLTAIGTALRSNAGIASIAVCDSRADMPPEFVKGIDDRNKLVREKGMRAIAQTMVERWFTAPTLAAKPAYLDKIKGMIAATSVEGFTSCAEAIKTSGLRERISKIALPALFLVGDQDAALPVELMRKVQSEVPGSRFAEIKGAGHISNVEQPEAFNQALLGFLASV